jgi:hypothetical protein
MEDDVRVSIGRDVVGDVGEGARISRKRSSIAASETVSGSGWLSA